MRHLIESIRLSHKPKRFNKNTGKELLQYAIAGLLYTPATNSKIASDIIERKHPEFTAICLDLEDSVGDEAVAEAEKVLYQTLTDLYAALRHNRLHINDLPLIFIRVRSAQQMVKLGNLYSNAIWEVITGFTLPKFDSSNCEQYIAAFTGIREKAETALYIMPIIESRNVMYKETRYRELNFISQQLTSISQSVLNIRVGATDFSNIYAVRRGIGQTIYQVGVVAEVFADIINYFGKNYVISGPVWEYFDSNNKPGPWSEGLVKELELDKINGFIGKTCIHPSQLPYIIKNNIVTYEEYRDAINILAMNDGLVGIAKGYGNNKMNEAKTHINWAKKITGLAEVYGVLEKEND